MGAKSKKRTKTLTLFFSSSKWFLCQWWLFSMTRRVQSAYYVKRSVNLGAKNVKFFLFWLNLSFQNFKYFFVEIFFRWDIIFQDLVMKDLDWFSFWIFNVSLSLLSETSNPGKNLHFFHRSFLIKFEVDYFSKAFMIWLKDEVSFFAGGGGGRNPLFHYDQKLIIWGTRCRIEVRQLF